jgi:outer membrane lipoprotein-sorting protein
MRTRTPATLIGASALALAVSVAPAAAQFWNPFAPRPTASVPDAPAPARIAPPKAAPAKTAQPAARPKPRQVAQQAPQSQPKPPLAIGPGSGGAAAAPRAAPAPAQRAPAPGQTTGFDASQRQLLERVNMYLMSVTTLVGDFVQVGPDGRKAQGKLYLQKPGRIRFEYDPPSVIELVADGSSLVVRDRKLATQDLYPLSQTPLRFLLADRIDLLRDTNVISVQNDDLFVSVVIEERQTLGGTHRLMLMFDAKDLTLKQWTITDPQGYDTTVAVYNLDASKKLDPSMFRINYERVIQ